MPKSKKVAGKTANCIRSRCPVACTLDLLGDKWTLLLVRDLLLGKSTYSEFEQSPERIPSNILAERLKRLTAHGVAEKVLYQQHPRRYRYRLTPKGRDLYPVLSAMIDWGNRHVPGTLTRKEIEALLERV